MYEIQKERCLDIYVTVVQIDSKSRKGVDIYRNYLYHIHASFPPGNSKSLKL